MNTIPRPKSKRIIRHEPDIQYFNPQPHRNVNYPLEILTFDELEAMRLKHLAGKTQEESARLMDISQSTFSRILESAHTKVTAALVEGKSIHLTGGEYSLKEFNYGYGCECGFEWFIDIDQNDIMLEPTQEDMEIILPLDRECPKCKSKNIYRLIRDFER
ncbi:MAG: DUF134 domain-containing protein [Candidatus Lokiarchaeota archaeon]|nr:DUF134 domain-containing protein [Candidatus Lokiarchaeota archaeon]